MQPGHPIRFCAPEQEGGQLSVQPGRKALLPTERWAVKATSAEVHRHWGYVRPPAAEHAHYQQPCQPIAAARPGPGGQAYRHRQARKEQGCVGTTMHPRDSRLATRPVSIKLGLLTLSSRETKAKPWDCGTPPDLKSPKKSPAPPSYSGYYSR